MRDPPRRGTDKLEIPGVRDVFLRPANVESGFGTRGLERVEVEFNENPSFPVLLDSLRDRYGEPEAVRMAADAFAESKTSWRESFGDVSLEVQATEVQGVLRVLYRLRGE